MGGKEDKMGKLGAWHYLHKWRLISSDNRRTRSARIKDSDTLGGPVTSSRSCVWHSSIHQQNAFLAEMCFISGGAGRRWHASYQRRCQAVKGGPLEGRERHSPLLTTSNVGKQKDKEDRKPDLKVKLKSASNWISFSRHFLIYAYGSPRDLVKTTDWFMPWSDILDFFFCISLHLF